MKYSKVTAIRNIKSESRAAQLPRFSCSVKRAAACSAGYVCPQFLLAKRTCACLRQLQAPIWNHSRGAVFEDFVEKCIANRSH